MKQLYVFLVLAIFMAELCASAQAQAIQSIQVNPDPLIPGENFTVTLEATGVRQAAVLVDIRRLDGQKGTQLRVRLDPVQGQANTFSGSGAIPGAIAVNAPDFIDFHFTINGIGRQRVTQTQQVPLLKDATQRGQVVIEIQNPVNNAVTRDVTTTVSGTFGGSTAIQVNGIQAAIAGNTFEATNIPLAEGVNVIVATGRNFLGETTSQTVHVRKDTTAPLVVIESPQPGDRLVNPTVAIAGTVNDIIPGAQVNADDVSVTINGIPAPVHNRTFFINNLPLQIGNNIIRAEATDVAGNSSSREIQISREPNLAGIRVQVKDGNAQEQPINTTLPDQFEVMITDSLGAAVTGRPVLFEVSNGDGLLGNPLDKARITQVVTDAQGVAQMQFTLGSRTGQGFHRVKASTPGSLASAEFCATATTNPPSNIAIGQMAPIRGQVNKVLPMAISGVITDSGGNPVKDVSVHFEVIKGGGSFENNKPFIDVLTNADGIAEANWRLGADPGLLNNEAQANFIGNPGLPAVFLSSGISTGPIADTKISGVVQNNAGDPIIGAKAVVRGTALEALTGADGQFVIDDVPPGGHHVAIMGSNANNPGQGIFYPDIEFEVEALAGVNNKLDPPIVALPFLNNNGAKLVGGATEQLLFMEGVPGFSVRIKPNSTFRRNPATGALEQVELMMSSSQVKFDKVPMPPPQGSTPMVVGTLQPGGILFNPPAEVCYPNVEGFAPGDVADVFAFHHDIGQFVNVGPGTVSEDGTVICSDPGFGIVQSGWHCLIRLPGPAGNCQRVNDCTATWDWKITSNGSGNDTNKPIIMKHTGDPANRQTAQVTVTFDPAGTLEGNWTIANGAIADFSGSITGNTVNLTALSSGSTTITSPINRIAVAGDEPDKTCQVVIELHVLDVKMHPADGDFAATKIGRVMISTKHDNAYYTNKKTTKADKVAQTKDRKVTVTAHITPAAAAVGKTVYFRVVNPDLDDKSPYEAGNATGDNRATTDKSGKLSAPSNVAELKTINGVQVAAAEVELTITDRYSGDNYQVECSLDSGFASICDKTSIMVAWKRIYLEKDNMLKKGATVTSAFATDFDLGIFDDVLTVDDTSDFSVGDNVTVFTSAGATENRTVTAKTATTLTVGDLGIPLPKYSGVKLTADNTSYTAGLDLVDEAYGDTTDGSDGGAFVEFVDAPTGSGNIPKYTSFPNDGDIVSFAFCEHWFNNSGSKANLFQIVAANKHADGSFGTTAQAKNICFITTGNFAFGANNAAAISETTVHEIAHQFQVANGHVDQNVNEKNHANTDECVMSYNRDRDNSIAEFDTDCLYDIRDAVEPR